MHTQAEFISIIVKKKKKSSSSELRPLPANKNILISYTKVLTYASKNLKDTKDRAFTKTFQNRPKVLVYSLINSFSPKQ